MSLATIPFQIGRLYSAPLEPYEIVGSSYFYENKEDIPEGLRFPGMETFVVSENKKYILIGGITDSDWEEQSILFSDFSDVSFSGLYSDLIGIPSEFNPSSHTHTESDISDLDKYSQLNIQNFFSGVNPIGGYNKTSWDSAYDFTDNYSISDYYSSLDSRYEVISKKGAPNGYVPLNAGAKISETYLPDSITGQVSYQGVWNPNTNTPQLDLNPDSSTKGDYYIVTNSGTFNSIEYLVGDWIISDGSSWSKVDNTDSVTSVFGRLGNILPIESDYESFYPKLSSVYSNPSWIGSIVYSKITGGSSSDFVKADGSIDSNDYALSSSIPTDFVSASSGGTFSGSIIVRNKISLFDSNSEGFYIERDGSNNNPVLNFISNGSWNGGTYLSLGGGLDNIETNKPLVSSNTITSTSFIKTSGTSSEFLKADGSVDSNSYALQSSIPTDFVPASTGGSFNGNVTINSSNFLKLKTIQAPVITGEPATNLEDEYWIDFDVSGKRGGNAAGITIGKSAAEAGDISNQPYIRIRADGAYSYMLENIDDGAAWAQSIGAYDGLDKKGNFGFAGYGKNLDYFSYGHKNVRPGTGGGGSWWNAQQFLMYWNTGQIEHMPNIEGDGSAVKTSSSEPSDWFVLASGTTDKVPLRFKSGVLSSSIKDGSIEYDGNTIYLSQGGERVPVNQLIRKDTDTTVFNGNYKLFVTDDDSKVIQISGGSTGAVSSGSQIISYGDDHATNAGILRLRAGNNGYLDFYGAIRLNYLAGAGNRLVTTTSDGTIQTLTLDNANLANGAGYITNASLSSVAYKNQPNIFTEDQSVLGTLTLTDDGGSAHITLKDNNSLEGSASGYILIKDSGSTNTGLMGMVGDTLRISSYSNTSSISLRTNNIERARLTQTQLVSENNLLVNNYLSINHGTTGQLRISNVGATTDREWWFQVRDSGNFEIRNNDLGKTVFSIEGGNTNIEQLKLRTTDVLVQDDLRVTGEIITTSYGTSSNWKTAYDWVNTNSSNVTFTAGGNSGYIPRFTDNGTTIGNSVIQNQGTTVSIGGDTTINGNLISDNLYLGGISTGAGIATIRTSSTNEVGLRVENSTGGLFTVDNEGDVIINGSLTVGNNTLDNPFKIVSTDSIVALQMQDVDNVKSIIYTGSTDTFSFSSGSNFLVDGNASINGNLTVTNNLNSVIKLENTATSISNDNYTLDIDSSAHSSNLASSGSFAVRTYYGKSFYIDGLGNTNINGNLSFSGGVRRIENTSSNLQLRAVEMYFQNESGSATRAGLTGSLFTVNVDTSINGQLKAGSQAYIGRSGSNYDGIGFNTSHTASTNIYKYAANDTASYIRFDLGGFVFKGSSTGIAGNNINFTDLFSINIDGTLTSLNHGTSANWKAAYDYSQIGHLTANQTITLSGAVSGSGSTSIVTTLSDNIITASKLTDNAISGHPALTGTLSSTDEFIISDNGTLRRMDVSVLQTYMQNNLSFGGGSISTVNAGTNLTGGGSSSTVTLNVSNSPTFSGVVTASNFVKGSDIRLKSDINKINSFKDISKSIDIFKYKKNKSNNYEFGVIANNLINTELDFIVNKSTEYLSVDYDSLSMIGLGLSKENSSEIDKLKNKIIELEREINKLNKK